MTQGQWMKGCPEGGEQGFLFSLYSQLSEGTCPCPLDCGASVPRHKGDFFSIYVSLVFNDMRDYFLVMGCQVRVLHIHRTLAEDCPAEMQYMRAGVLFCMRGIHCGREDSAPGSSDRR